MKRLSVLILIALFLSACGTSPTPTISDSEMATKVAQILTTMPTTTGAAPDGLTPTAGLPTIAPTQAQPTQAPTVAPTQAPTEAAPTATPTQVPPTSTPTKVPPTPTTGPTPTLVSGDPRASLGNPTWRDTMANSDNWPTGEDTAGFTDIDFSNGTLRLTALKPMDGWRIGVSPKLTDFYLEETVNTGSCSGSDRYGLIFRVPVKSNPDQGYLAAFTCDGKYSLRKWDGPNDAMIPLTAWKASPYVKSGANQANRLGVMVKGSKITLYANGTALAEVSDPSYAAGYFGVFAGSLTSTTYTIIIDEVDYWLQ
jgi:hypothetical protein